MEALAGADACCEPVYNIGEALASAPVQALGMLAGEELLPPVRLSAQPTRPAGHAPALGQNTAPLLAELGYDQGCSVLTQNAQAPVPGAAHAVVCRFWKRFSPPRRPRGRGLRALESQN